MQGLLSSKNKVISQVLNFLIHSLNMEKMV